MSKIKTRRIRNKDELITDIKEFNEKKVKTVTYNKKDNDDISSKIRKRKLRNSDKDFVVNKKNILKSDGELDETKLDREIDAEDNLSIGLIFLILIACLVLGIGLGYLLYRIALNSSALIMFRFML